MECARHSWHGRPCKACPAGQMFALFVGFLCTLALSVRGFHLVHCSPARPFKTGTRSHIDRKSETRIRRSHGCFSRLHDQQWSLFMANDSPCFSSSPIVEFIHPKTGCHVSLVGCFHGSPSSAHDVETVLLQDNNDSSSTVVALELCPDRYRDLQRLVKASKSQSNSKQKQERRQRDSGAWNANLVGAVLGGVAAWQASWSGLEPGLEFVTAWNTTNDVDVLLVDRPVDETLRRIGDLPRVAWELLTRRPLQEIPDLSRALALSLGWQASSAASVPTVQLSKVVWRNPLSRQEWLRLMLPPFVLFVSLVAGTALLANAEGPSPPAIQEYMEDWSDDDVFGLLRAFGVWLVAYIGLVLPATKVVLVERDAVLANGIRQACEWATAAGGGGDSRVVAVLGLLHVNGVAERLLLSDEDDSFLSTSSSSN